MLHIKLKMLTCWELTFWEVDILEVDISGFDILGAKTKLYALPSFSHFSHFIANACLTIPKACATPTNSNPHMLVQRLLRCVQGIHCEYVHLVSSNDSSDP